MEAYERQLPNQTSRECIRLTDEIYDVVASCPVETPDGLTTFLSPFKMMILWL